MMKAAVLAGALVAMAGAAWAQDQVDVPIEQASRIAAQAVLAGDPATALEIAEAILVKQPDNRDALVVVAAAAPQLGRAEEGRRAGARAWRLSETPAQRYEAARLTALAAVNAQEFTRASLWLRLALISAPNDAERARTITDGRNVARQNPWSTQLSFSLVPSNNVNGGAETAQSSAPGNPTGTLSEDAIALSGWRGSLGLATQYRLHQSQQSRTTVGFQANVGRVWITEETTVPDEAFDNGSATLSLQHERLLGTGTLSAGLSYGIVEYRDLDLSAETTEAQRYDVWRLSLERRLPVSDQATVGFSYGRELLQYEATGIGEINRNTLGASLTYALPSADQIGVSFSVIDSDGDSVNYDSREQSVRLSYRWAEPLGPVSLALGLGARWADYPDYRILFPVTGGRQDETVTADATIGFPDVSFAGFTPQLRIDVSDTKSNVSRFDRTTTSVGFTISSQF